MTFTFLKCKITISVFFAAFIAILLTIDKSAMMTISLSAIAIHELGHIVAMYFCNNAPRRIILKPAVIDIVKVSSKSYNEEIFISLMGPVFNSIVALFAMCFIHSKLSLLFVTANMITCFFNLLPVYSFDGYTVLKCAFSLKFEEDTCKKIINVTSIIFTVILTALGLIFFLINKNISLMFIGLYLCALNIIKGRR